MMVSRKMLVVVQSAVLSMGLTGISVAAETPRTDTPPERGSSSVVDDSVITAKVKSALVADKEVKAFDINVKTRKGEVVLSGDVDNQNHVDRAIQIASNVDGVKSVSNRMNVKR